MGRGRRRRRRGRGRGRGKGVLINCFQAHTVKTEANMHCRMSFVALCTAVLYKVDMCVSKLMYLLYVHVHVYIVYMYMCVMYAYLCTLCTCICV